MNLIKLIRDAEASENIALMVMLVAMIITLGSIFLTGLAYLLFYHTAIAVLIIGGLAVLFYASWGIVKIIRML